MTISELIKKINTDPDSIDFTEVIQTIDANYHYTPVRFTNGAGENIIINAKGSNEGSCKIFYFGKLNKLDINQTLACFGLFYRKDVLAHPDKKDHANVRNFMIHGWEGINFEGEALKTIKNI